MTKQSSTGSVEAQGCETPVADHLRAISDDLRLPGTRLILENNEGFWSRSVGNPDVLRALADLLSRHAQSTQCCKGLAPVAECQCEIERKTAGHPPYQRGEPAQQTQWQPIETAEALLSKKGYAAWHPDNGLMMSSVSLLPQEAAAILMRTGVAGNHGWQIVPVEVCVPRAASEPSHGG